LGRREGDVTNSGHLKKKKGIHGPRGRKNREIGCFRREKGGKDHNIPFMKRRRKIDSSEEKTRFRSLRQSGEIAEGEGFVQFSVGFET